MTALIVESWIWWSFVIIIAIARFVSRRITLRSFSKYQLDDYLMMLVLCFYTTLIVTINIVRNTSSNLLPPGYDVASLTPADIRSRTYGSKLVLVVEQCQCVTIWGAKACLLIMYLRLTTFRKENIAIKILAAYVGITFVVMEILYFAVWCRPFHEYWAVPTNSSQCDAATNHLITNAVFNLSSDCAMIAIGLPMFLRLKLPWQKKLPLIMIFSLGVFVILAAILNKVYSFTQPFGAEWTYWYTRESSTALLVANLPFIWPVVKKVTGLKTRDGESGQYALTSFDRMHLGMHRHKTRESAGDASSSSNGRSTAKGEGNGEDAIDPMADDSKENSGLTLEQMLMETNPQSSEKPPNPYTHPALFYQQAPGPAQPAKAVVRQLDPAYSPKAIDQTSALDDSFTSHAGASAQPSLHTVDGEDYST